MRRGAILFLLLGLALLSLNIMGQQARITGPTQMGQCEKGTFTITITNVNPTESLCAISVTNTRPNEGFYYVAGTSLLTLHDGTTYNNDPAQLALDLIWAIDEIAPQSPSYKLPPGESLKIIFDMATSCSAISGTDVVKVDYTGCETGNPRQTTDSISIEIAPGAVAVYKEPSIISASVGEEVIWTVTVENTGLGPIRNVVVSDLLGAGLAYVSSNPPGQNLGQTIIWDSAAIPALHEIQPGGKVSMEVTARVISCSDLDNKADARFGCDSDVCYDTAVDGGTATASIRLIINNPLLDFTSPNISIPYCDLAGTTVTMPVRNNGAGPARNIRICANFPASLSVRNIRGGASWDGSCFHLPDLAGSESFDLMFDLLYTEDWCAGGPSGGLYWQAIYENVCGDEFRPPAVFGSYSTDYSGVGQLTLSASIKGDEQIYICTTHTYNLSVSLSGLDTWRGSVSDISVVVNVPTGFIVIDAGGGSWTPGGDRTGGTITWTIGPATPLNTSITLQAPGFTQCGQVTALSVTATATAIDYCGCKRKLSSGGSVPIAIECYQLVTTAREATPITQEKCGTITYTNNYWFLDDPALGDISFNELTFIEYADNQRDYVEGSLRITIDGMPVAPITVVDTTPGGTFEIRGINDTRSVRGHTLVISYQLAFTPSSQPASCPGSSTFYSWTTLDLGPDCLTGDKCTEPCQVTEKLLVTATTPSMSVSITGLPGDFIGPCGTYDITMTLTKTSNFEPLNVRLQLENLNYIVDLGTLRISGVQPKSTIPADYGTYYEWNYGNAFVGQPRGTQSVLTFQVRKRCNPGLSLFATALFEDSCGYSSCSVSASEAPSIMLEPLVYVYKTPEVIYATENKVTWKIYVMNGGAGSAYEVWVEDILGSGLEYLSSTVDPDVNTYPGRNHKGEAINGVSWHIPVIGPGGTRTITVTARLVACQGLTDEVWAGQSCGDVECITPVSDTSHVLIPTSRVVATSYTDSPMAPCATQEAQVTIRNAGDPTVYHLEASMTLPSGISYVPGSTKWRKGTGAWNPGLDPTIVGSTLTWTEAEIIGLAELRARETIEIQAGITAGCDFRGGNLVAQSAYENVCGDHYTSALGIFYLRVRLASLSVTKSQVDPPAWQPIDCNDPNNRVTWEITVSNTGARADWVRLEDTLAASLEYVSSDPAATPMGGQKWGWEFGPLESGESRTFRLTARLIRPTEDCSSALRTNSAQATWGCGPFDGDPNTSGEQICSSGLWTQGSALVTIPDLSLSPSDIMPSFTCSSDGDYSGQVWIRIRNNGDAPVNKDFSITLIESTTGWTVIGTFTGFGGSLPIRPGSSQILTIPGWPVTCEKCGYTFTVALDTENDICECREGNNTATQSYTITIPDIEVTGENLSVTCLDDGQSLISGTVTLANNGCGSALTADIPVRFTLYGTGNCGGAQLDQWTQVFTGVNIPAGSSRSFSIASRTVNANLCASTSCGVSINVEADYLSSICECDGTNNRRCSATKAITYPDLVVTDIDFSGIICSNDSIAGSVAVTVHNQGCGPAGPFKVTLATDGCLSFSEQTVAGLMAGESTTVTFPISEGWADCTDCSCTFTATVDPENRICECSGANSYTKIYTSSFPDLRVRAIVPDVADSCTQGTAAVTVENIGCGTAPAGTIVRITGDATGEARTSVPLGQGEAETVMVTLDKALPCGDYGITAVVDPDNEVCECNGENQSLAGSFSIVDPDLSPQNFEVICNGDDTFTITAEIHNFGGEGAQGATIRVYADENLIYSESRDIPAGGVHRLQFMSEPLKCGFSHRFRIVVDEGGAICECNETNNEIQITSSCPCPALVTEEEIVKILRNGSPVSPGLPVEPGDLVTYRLTVTNVGEGKAFNVDVTDTLPAEFTYVTGTTSASWPGGSSTADPAGAPGPNLLWDLSATLAQNEAITLTFQVGVTSAVGELKSYTAFMCATGQEGNGDPIPPDNSALVPQDTDPDDCSSVTQLTAVPALVTEKAVASIIRGRRPVTQPLMPRDIVTFELMARNVGSGTAYSVEISDSLPQGFAYIPGSTKASWPSGSSTADPTISGQILTWSLAATLQGVESLTLTFNARVLEDVLPGLHDNCMHARGRDRARNPIPPDRSKDVPADIDPDDSSCTTLIVAIPALVTEKSVVKITRAREPVGAPVEPGDIITFQLVVTNVGNGLAYNVEITDILPEGFKYVTGTTYAEWPGGFDTLDPLGASGPLLFWTLFLTLNPGERLILTFNAMVISAIRDGEIYCNVMHATGVNVTGESIPPDQSRYIPEDTDTDDSSTVCLQAHVPAAPGLVCEKAHALADRIWFQTDIAMYAASEFQLLRDLFTPWTILPETLLPSWIRTTQAEAGDYAFDNLIQVSAASKVGLSLAYGPLVLKSAAEKGLSPEAALEELLSHYAELAELASEGRPGNESWIFVEYAGGDPRYRERDDDLWPGGSWKAYDRRIVPSALGMSLAKQVREARALLASDRPLDRYLALVLTEAMVNKLLLLDSELALALPEKGIRYFAHAYGPRLDEQGRPTGYEATDKASHLFDQLAMLWGLAEFATWSDPGINSLFGEGKIFSPEYHKLALELAVEVFKTILTLHHDGEGNLWDFYSEGGRAAGQNSWDIEAQASSAGSSTVNLGLLLLALERAKGAFARDGESALAAEAAALITAQAEKLLERQTPEGGFSDGLDSEGKLTPARTLAAQLAAIRGLLVAQSTCACQADRRQDYLTAAKRAFDYLELAFWNDQLRVYAAWTDGRKKRYCHTPLEIGLAVGALRELGSVLVSEPQIAGLILSRLSQFFRAIVDTAALQLSNALVLPGDLGLGSRSCEIFHGNGLGEIAPLVLVGSPWGVAPVLQQQLCLDLAVSTEPCGGIWADLEPWFQTDIAMYAAYEIQEVAPKVEDYADSNLTNLVMYSRMGIPLASGPYLLQLARERSLEPEALFQRQLETYAELAGLTSTSIPELAPLALEFYSGSPRLREPEKLAWSPETFDRRIVGSAIGMTLLREVQEAKQLLEGDREPLERFYGLVLVAAIENKLAFLDELAQERLKTTGRAYIPHATRATFREGRLVYEVVDPGSELFDQLAMLWGLGKAYGLVSDSRYFGPGKPFSLATPELVAKLAKGVLRNLLELHLDRRLEALVERADFRAGSWRKSGEITTTDLGLVVAALGDLAWEMADRTEVQRQAVELMQREIEFLIRRLADGSGGYFDRYSITTGRPEGRSLAGQLAAIRALLVAYESFREARYLSLAQQAFDFLERFWHPMLESCIALEWYTNPLGNEVPCYTPLELGLAVGALERLARSSELERAVFIRGRLWTFFDRIADGARMQLPPVVWWRLGGAATGEPSDIFAQVLARRVCLRPVERE